MATSMQARVIEDAVRLGSLASLAFAMFALLTNILIPRFIANDHHTGAVLEDRPRSKPQISMSKAWSISHLLFALCMFSTFFIHSQIAATVLAALVGISWAFTLWVPFAIIGREVAARQEKHSKILEGEFEPAQQDQAGAIMGLHNVAISVPQMLAGLVCGCIFWVASRSGSQDGIGWALRFGGMGTLIAAVLAARIKI
jgi:solute carrier family 45 protein 1/2/4